MFLLAALACSTWIDQKPACSLDVYDWSDDLLAHILTGEGDGSFDYDPADTPRNRIEGSYKAKRGDFTWEEGYADDYWLKAASVEGYGTAYHDGNLDILQTTEWRDVLDDTWITEKRVLREGCNMVIQSVDPESGEVTLEESGRYDTEDSYHWSADIEGYHFQGGFRRNLSYTFNQDADNGSFSLSYAWSPKGTGEGEWIEECVEGCDCVASYHDRFDGGRETEIEVTCDGDVYAEVVADYAYDGSGTEHQDYADGTTCDFTTDSDGSCHFECSDGQQGRC